MGVFKKQGVYWIDYDVQGRRKQERIGSDKSLAEALLQNCKRERKRVVRWLLDETTKGLAKPPLTP